MSGGRLITPGRLFLFVEEVFHAWMAVLVFINGRRFIILGGRRFYVWKALMGGMHF